MQAIFREFTFALGYSNQIDDVFFLFRSNDGPTLDHVAINRSIRCGILRFLLYFFTEFVNEMAYISQLEG